MAKLPLPATLKIGPHTYPVVVQETLEHEGQPAWGQWDAPALTIRLDSRVTDYPDHALSTLVHEALHVIDRQYGFAWDECTVGAVATVLTALLLDNPALLALARKVAG